MALLSVIIPAYNEERTILPLLERVIAVRLPGIKKEIIIIDNNSTDRTATLVREYIRGKKGISLHSCKVQGKGAAVREGIRRSKGDVVIIQDADLEYDPADYKACTSPIFRKKARVVYGSRLLHKGNRISHLSYHLGGRLISLATSILYLTWITDEPTCYKAFDGKLIRRLEIRGNRFDWEPEITAKVLRKGHAIMEVPIKYNPRKKTEGKKIRWIDGVEAIWTLIVYRFRD
jgi:dolichol-phosphate mannosyltransferase